MGARQVFSFALALVARNVVAIARAVITEEATRLIIHGTWHFQVNFSHSSVLNKDKVMRRGHSGRHPHTNRFLSCFFPLSSFLDLTLPLH